MSEENAWRKASVVIEFRVPIPNGKSDSIPIEVLRSLGSGVGLIAIPGRDIVIKGANGTLYRMSVDEFEALGFKVE